MAVPQNEHVPATSGGSKATTLPHPEHVTCSALAVMGWSAWPATVLVNSCALTAEPAMSACVFPQCGHFSWPVSGLNCIPAPQPEQTNCSFTAASAIVQASKYIYILERHSNLIIKPEI